MLAKCICMKQIQLFWQPQMYNHLFMSDILVQEEVLDIKTKTLEIKVKDFTDIIMVC